MVSKKNNKDVNKQRFYRICATVLIVAFANIIIKSINKFAEDSFKRLYGSYSKALSMTAYEMDGDIGCYFSEEKDAENNFSGCEEFYKKFVSNLKVTKYCKDNGKKNGCVPKYKKFTSQSVCSGYSKEMMNIYDQSYILSDQTNMIVFNMPKDSPKPLFAVDSNGNFPPNKTGYDLFSLVIMKKSNGEYYFHPNIVYCLPPEKKGIQTIQDVLK